MRRLALALAALLLGAAGWPDYQVIYWQDLPPRAVAVAREVGVTALRLRGTLGFAPGGIDPQELADRRASGLRWFVENIATDFYAPYHRYMPGRTPSALFDDVRRRHAEAPGDPAVFLRAPSLSDPAWLARVTDRLRDVVGRLRGDRPLYYSLADESGIGDLAAAWDFDLGPASLDGFRGWLHERYGSLAALNAEWGSDAAAWSDVRPMTTTEAMQRADGNLAPWADFKAWMDVAFARAVRAGTDAVHAADPDALAAIEGAQVPGWGGYDYGLLPGAVDVMEIYDSGGNVGIAHAVNPDLVLLTTSFAGGPAEPRRLWRELLAGGRGVVVWDDAHDFIAPDGSAGPRARELAPTLAALRGRAGRRILRARTRNSPVAVLYSQASFRVTWMQAHRALGDAWTQRGAETEWNDDNAWRGALVRVSGALARLGLAPGWITSAALERDGPGSGVRMLILPHSVALSDQEVAAIRRFAADGGTVLADGEPGRWDEHGRPRTGPIDLPVLPFDPQTLAGHVPPGAELRRPDDTPVADCDIRLLDGPGGTLIAIQRDASGGGEEPAILRLPAGAIVSMLLGAGEIRPDGLAFRLAPGSTVIVAVAGKHP